MLIQLGQLLREIRYYLPTSSVRWKRNERTCPEVMWAGDKSVALKDNGRKTHREKEHKIRNNQQQIHLKLNTIINVQYIERHPNAREKKYFFKINTVEWFTLCVRPRVYHEHWTIIFQLRLPFSGFFAIRSAICANAYAFHKVFISRTGCEQKKTRNMVVFMTTNTRCTFVQVQWWTGE